MERLDDVPDVERTELTRADLERAAAELGLEDVAADDDQRLLLRLGVEMGELAPDVLDAPADGDDGPLVRLRFGGGSVRLGAREVVLPSRDTRDDPSWVPGWLRQRTREVGEALGVVGRAPPG